MPYRTIPGTDNTYLMLAVDDGGVEISEDPDAPNGRISDWIIESIEQQGVTDVFIMIHGWKGAVADAFEQYDRWIGACLAQDDDMEQMLHKHTQFKPLHVGFHWPSLAWGDETVIAGNSFAEATALPLTALVDRHARELGDSPAVRSALTKLFDEVRTHAADDALTDRAREAYRELDSALALGADGAAGDGAADRPTFNPDQAMLTAQASVDYGGSFANGLLSPLRQLTFWTMKKRAKTVGERGLHPFIVRLQAAFPALRLHLMGHSFGCIVASAGLAGPGGDSPLKRPIDSCVLVQGAMSLWAFCDSIPVDADTQGYFSKILSNAKVGGPLVTTLSMHDYAVGRIYPWAAGVANQLSYDPLPRYGAIGAHGLCGVTDAVSLDMKPAAEPYGLSRGKIYNVNSSRYICKINGASGAHSDIAGPEVAHLIWQAALTGGEA